MRSSSHRRRRHDRRRRAGRRRRGLTIPRVAIAGLAAIAAAVATSGAAEARPQPSATFTLGLAKVGTREDPWATTRLAGGLRGDVLLLRERDLDWGVGPYAEAATFDGFRDAQLGGGASLLVPIHPYLPIVLSGGAYERHADAWGWEPGVAGALFWGSRGYNYHAPYSLTAGLLLQARRGLGDSHETALSVGAQLDLAFVALPFVYLWGAIHR